LIKFEPPTGFFFDANNRLVAGTPVRAEERTTIWASPNAVVDDGTNQGAGNFQNGQGPVTLNNFVPTGAIAVEVIPVFVTDLPSSVVQSVTEQIQLNRDFGLGFNNLTATWYVITSTNLDVNADWSLANAQNQTGQGIDASWFIQATTDGEN
jgi:hypothetical protein